ncbi:hydrogenase nickel incorporation protein HypB [Saccharopolyspora sp. CA-218241]|uniref:hydrogenase nickel incorporation protein HypB n=1 Tax=Saccharopolyspora sp. CA-218241 TaxID=3240027 RepID=UPI003D95E68D
MCATCGCDEDAQVRISIPTGPWHATGHPGRHDHDHAQDDALGPDHAHDHGHGSRAHGHGECGDAHMHDHAHSDHAHSDHAHSDHVRHGHGEGDHVHPGHEDDSRDTAAHADTAARADGAARDTAGRADGAARAGTAARAGGAALRVEGRAGVPPARHRRPRASRKVSIEQDVLAKNNALAAANRRDLAERGVVAVNLMSSPGAGKTTLLERTIRELGGSAPIAVVEGDQETQVDAERIRAAGCPVVQVNTGSGCHLDAEMLARAVVALDPGPGSLLFVENVGNLVCPALFDLGETRRVVVMSVPEGADKPIKYPHMFREADLVLINKADLLPHVDFDPARCAEQVRRLNPGAEVLLVSATTGEGLPEWFGWLRSGPGRPVAAPRGAAEPADG